MISVILYGRNDSYGYNLHKRAALSLNCIAAVLDAPDDEILFVDYNTPDDFPSFPEAILDTLTPRARALVRVLRVRPAQHRRFAGRSHLVALEPIARNVALRRANPANRWVLSTNTDMIFIPRAGGSLSAIVAGLPDGTYHLPRLELPESLWESLERGDPEGCLRRVADWGARFHLNEYVESPYTSIRYDGPGDFQLMLRSDLHAIHGFDEAMLLGWHVDFNIAQRMALLRGPTATLEHAVLGYHCDHTRQVTPAHRANSVENDLQRFGFGLTEPVLAAQAESWGLAGEAVEEIRLDARPPYEAALEGAIGAPQTEPARLLMAAQTVDRVSYDPRHVLPFLLDPLASHPRTTVLGWFGSRPELLGLLAGAWAALGFTGPILVAEGAPWAARGLPPGAVRAASAEIAERADVLVFDFALPEGCDCVLPPGESELPPALHFVAAGLHAMLAAEEARDPELPARRFIGVNAIHNRFEALMRSRIGAARAPLATRIRQGLLIRRPPGAAAAEAGTLPAPGDGVLDIQAMLLPGEAGERDGSAIRPVPGRRGHVLHGPYIDLPPGRWRFEQVFTPDSGLPRPGPLRLRAVYGARELASATRLVGGVFERRIAFDFEIAEPPPLAEAMRFEIRITSLGQLRGRLDGARLLPIPQADSPQAETPQAETPQAGTPQAGTPKTGTPKTGMKETA